MRVPTIAPPPLPPGHAHAAAVLRDLRAADTSWAAPRRRPRLDPYRYDPNRLLPRSAMVRRVRVDQIPHTVEQTPVSQLCAAAGLVYAERHVAAALALYADWNTMVPEATANGAAKAEVA